MESLKILINTPHLKKAGGVSNHYSGLKEFWSDKVRYNNIGSRFFFPGPVILPFDLLKFIYKCQFHRPELIVLNPSLGKTAIERDALFLKICKYFKIPSVVFFHGWDEKMELEISRNPEFFLRKFNATNAFLVLASGFKEIMKEWGVDKPIYLTSTKVDDILMSNFDFKSKKSGHTILFLARLELNKGILIVIKAFVQIKLEYPKAKLVIAGSGSAMEDAKKLVEDLQLNDVFFLGNISGKNLRSTFSTSDIYILPTTHGEGMPTSVLEAMAFGLPVITRPVGGLIDFFQNEIMGYVVEDISPNSNASRIRELFDNKKLMDEMGRFNHIYAKKHFYASKVAKDLELIFRKIKYGEK